MNTRAEIYLIFFFLDNEVILWRIFIIKFRHSDRDVPEKSFK